MAFLADGASSTSVLRDAAATGCAAAAVGAAPPATAPEAEITASLALASTVAPSTAAISVNTPAAGAGTSMLTLSVSNSQIISSWATASPTALNQVLTVASVTDSPRVGTITLTRALPASVAGVVLALCLGASPDAAAPSRMVANKASTPTVCPSGAIISPSAPAMGEGTSTVTLSVSSSHSISSTLTASPGFLNQVATVASVTLSPRVGTRTSVVIVLSFNGQRFVDERGLLGFVLAGKAGGW